ncbi:MAG: efflux RND transporter permease subunit, partial [Gammaproteobacteria bacterium]|nr:efflux RND transporter permease subunit [Gammaproteobacteria bacterium]
QEGRMFSPLAYTKTYAMAAAAALAVTLIPVLMGYLIRGKVRPEQKNPLNRFLSYFYHGVLTRVLSFPKTTLFLALIITVLGFWPANKIGTEFIPQLDEGDLMYMPTTYPGISIGKARELLQQTDKLIKTVPEVATVFGKVGRAETATDPAPLTMIETFIQLKPKAEWREGMTTELLKKELDNLVQFPGVTNAWVMPIKTRIDMLATGIKTPIGIKIAGPELAVIEELGKELEQILGAVEGTTSVYAERVVGGRYLKIDIQRDKAARFGMNVSDIQQVVSTAVGGMNVTQTVEGQARYPVNLRYKQDYRTSPEALANLPMVTPLGARITLGDVTNIYIDDGPAMIKSENARINGWVYIDIAGVDIGDYINTAKDVLNRQLVIPSGYSIKWSGQYEYMQRAQEKLTYVVPLTLAIIFLLLYLAFRDFRQVSIILATLPLAVIGGIWLMYTQGYNFSVAAGVGFIALAGVAVEIGVIMLVYINQAIRNQLQLTPQLSLESFRTAIQQGASQRIRPVMMTSISIILGLLPILLDTGTGSEIMSRIAAPMIGGMISALLLTLVVLPAAYYLVFAKQYVQSK